MVQVNPMHSKRVKDPQGNSPTKTDDKAVRKWFSDLRVKTLYIELGSRWENGYIESFYRKMRNELFEKTFLRLAFADFH